MEKHQVKIGVLTSSRADYGIYLPLLKAIKKESFCKLEIIAFGTHLKNKFGRTVDQIISDGFNVKYCIDNLIHGDQALDIVKSYANTVDLFGDFWCEHGSTFDVIICLGDRFEMAAAVNAGIPFNMNFAHLHAGETSEGAIDNIYRTQITSACNSHFISLPQFQSRVEKIVGKKGTTTLTGAISLENLKTISLLNHEEFMKQWGIDLTIPSILLTVHPETIDYNKNHHYVKELEKTLMELSSRYQIVITMTNADTLGNLYRNMYHKVSHLRSNICIVENLGSQSYFSAMEMTQLLIGNSSSGIIEAASFQKYAINIGDRQKNRLCSKNVVNVPFNHKDIIKATDQYIDLKFNGENIYSYPEGISLILEKLKNLNESKNN